MQLAALGHTLGLNPRTVQVFADILFNVSKAVPLLAVFFRLSV